MVSQQGVVLTLDTWAGTNNSLENLNGTKCYTGPLDLRIFFSSVYGSVEGFCQDVNELSASMKGTQFLDRLCYYYLLKDAAPRSSFIKVNKKFWEDLIAYYPLYDTGHIENYASSNSSIVACVFVTTVTFLPSRCQAMIREYLQSRCLATIRKLYQAVAWQR
jgi:hypothetical protein